MKTFIKQLKNIEPRRPTLLEGFPGLGYIGMITVSYMVKQLNAKKFAEVYSPFFPHHIITNNRGGARLPRADLYFWKNPTEGKDIIFLTTDAQAQTVEGQYEVVNSFLDFAEEKKVERIVAIGGYSSKINGTPKIVCVSTNKSLLDEAIEAGAEISPEGNPIVGLAGLSLGLSKFRNMEAACILGETIGHMPDPAVSKSVLKVVEKLLNVNLDLAPLDRDIEKMVKNLKKMESLQHKMDDTLKKNMELESRKMNYIA